MKQRPPIRIGALVRTRELCLAGRVVVGRIRARYPGGELLAIEGVSVWCSARDAEPVEPGAQLTLV